MDELQEKRLDQHAGCIKLLLIMICIGIWLLIFFI